MMLTGYRVPGPELLPARHRRGLRAARAQLMERAMALAREIAGKSPAAIRLAKGALNTIEDMSLRDGYRYEQNLTVPNCPSTPTPRKPWPPSWRSASPSSGTADTGSGPAREPFRSPNRQQGLTLICRNRGGFAV